MSDLQRAFDHFKDVYLRYCAYYDYFDGNQPLRYSTERLKDAFQQIRPKFRQNWCSVVINSVLDRMELYGWSIADETLNAVLAEVWSDTGLSLESNEVHESALVCGESFLIGWREEGQPIEFYFNDPRRAACFYDSDRPKVKTYAAKWWDSDDGCHMLLYYPDRLERYIAPGKKMSEMRAEESGSFVLEADGISPNPFGVIPVFHFRNSLRSHESDLKNVTEIQDAINKLFCDMMVTAEFSAFPARYVISSADIQPLKNAPNQIWDLPAGLEGQQNTQVGTLEASNLNNYSNQIEALAQSISSITRTPRHYFEHQSTQISGEALITMEAPLVKKVQQKRELYGDVWQEVGAFALLAMGYVVRKNDIQPQWGKAEADQPLTETQIIMNYRSAGLPLKSALRLSGYTQAEIDIIEAEKAEERAEQEDLAGLYLEQARNESARENRI
jgi:hypothetical protein